VGLEEVWSYCSIQVRRFRGASVAVGAGRVGAVLDGESIEALAPESESESEEVEGVGVGESRLVNWETHTPIAIAARMTKTRPSPHCCSALA
jgi:hypothetical protein